MVQNDPKKKLYLRGCNFWQTWDILHLKEIESFFGITVYINSYLNGKTILQVKDASLARVLDLCTCLTNFGLLESHLCTGTPTENGKRPETRKFERYFAFMYTAIYKIHLFTVLTSKTKGLQALPWTDLAFFAKLFLGHPEIGIVTQAGLAQDGELVGLLPVHPVVLVRWFRHRHLGLEKKMFFNRITRSQHISDNNNINWQTLDFYVLYKLNM